MSADEWFNLFLNESTCPNPIQIKDSPNRDSFYKLTSKKLRDDVSDLIQKENRLRSYGRIEPKTSDEWVSYFKSLVKSGDEIIIHSHIKKLLVRKFTNLPLSNPIRKAVRDEIDKYNIDNGHKPPSKETMVSYTASEWFEIIRQEQSNKKRFDISEYRFRDSFYEYTTKAVRDELVLLVKSHNRSQKSSLNKINKLNFEGLLSGISEDSFFKFIAEQKPMNLWEIFQRTPLHFFWYLKHNKHKRESIKNKVAHYCDLDVKNIHDYSAEKISAIVHYFDDIGGIKSCAKNVVEIIYKVPISTKTEAGVARKLSPRFNLSDYETNAELCAKIITEKLTFTDLKEDNALIKDLLKSRPKALLDILNSYRDCKSEFEYKELVSRVHKIIKSTSDNIEAYKTALINGGMDYIAIRIYREKNGIAARSVFTAAFRCFSKCDADLSQHNRLWWMKKEELKEFILEFNINYDDLVMLPPLLALLKHKFLLSELHLTPEQRLKLDSLPVENSEQASNLIAA